jgi:GR25 family glycosyltransferase involved in LPS biosynthesis
MTARLGALGIPFQFVDAIEGRTGRLPDQFDGARVNRAQFGAEAGLACSMSHRLVHRMIVDNRHDIALVLEDDAMFASGFLDTLVAASKLEFDVFKLEGGRHHYRYVTVGRLGRYSVEVGMVPSFGAAAYLIKRSGALRFCSLSVIDRMNDVLFGDPRLNLRVLELRPFAAFQDGRTEGQLGFGSYSRETESRRSLVSKSIHSIRKRYRLARVHGLGMVAAMELTRFGKH